MYTDGDETVGAALTDADKQQAQGVARNEYLKYSRQGCLAFGAKPHSRSLAVLWHN